MQKYKYIYMIGIGGIGMSALARWFRSIGKEVAGYDRTPTELTDKLQDEGIEIHFEDSTDAIPALFLDSENCLVVYTPAVPENHAELSFFRGNGFNVLKRSEVLGLITKDVYTVAVGGTHGKTTTSTMIAHILAAAKRNVASFLGGIATNYESNYVVNHAPDYQLVMVVEADEYDRSFLRLTPSLAVITTVDPDHLDIYGDAENVFTAFNEFITKVGQNGTCLINADLEASLNIPHRYVTYGLDHGTCRAENIVVEEGHFVFDYVDDETRLASVALQQPGYHNISNAIAAIRVSRELGLSDSEIRKGIESYQGVKRRFEYHIKSADLVFVDDYAHHPVEIQAFLDSLKALYPGRKLTAVFQPHLYSRTRDFADGFAESLSTADEVILLDIYPAREEPIPGVTSKLIFEGITSEKSMENRHTVLDRIDPDGIDILATIGAGDIDQLVEPIKRKLCA